MIRGTNKRIIEISGEDGSCFERIVLFLRPEQEAADEEKILKLAEDYAGDVLKTSNAPALLNPPRAKGLLRRRWPLILGGALALVMLGFILLLL